MSIKRLTQNMIDRKQHSVPGGGQICRKNFSPISHVFRRFYQTKLAAVLNLVLWSVIMIECVDCLQRIKPRTVLGIGAILSPSYISFPRTSTLKKQTGSHFVSGPIELLKRELGSYRWLKYKPRKLYSMSTFQDLNYDN